MKKWLQPISGGGQGVRDFVLWDSFKRFRIKFIMNPIFSLYVRYRFCNFFHKFQNVSYGSGIFHEGSVIVGKIRCLLSFSSSLTLSIDPPSSLPSQNPVFSPISGDMHASARAAGNFAADPSVCRSVWFGSIFAFF